MGSKPVGYSASRIGALLGLSNYTTPFSVWQSIMEERQPGWNNAHGYTLPVFEGNSSTRWGLAFEPALCKLSSEFYNDEIINREKQFSKNFGEIELTCHIDGQFKNSGDLLENKTTNSMAYNAKNDERLRWGDELTDQVPEIYQVQCAVQRICTGADLVKLNVLVFPKAVDEFEADGWSINSESEYSLKNESKNKNSTPYLWAVSLEQMGYFHTYNLPSNPALEQAIIDTVQEIHAKNIVQGIPPEPRDYDDIRRLMSRPCGTIIAPPDLAEKCREYSEVVRQLGNAGPLVKRKAELRVEILNQARKLERQDWINPTGKLEIVSPDGGHVLASFSGDENGNQKFWTKRAK